MSHSWIIKSLELIGINNSIIFFTKKTTNYWKTSMGLQAKDKLIENMTQKYNVEYF
jgi:hypothetical protein